MDKLLTAIGVRLADYLGAPKRQGSLVATVAPDVLAVTLRPGDVLLVEGNTRVSVAIKYLTQSTWSHAALFVGNALPPPLAGEERRTLIEADLRSGVRTVGLSTYAGLHTRICRPVGLSRQDVRQLVEQAIGRIGARYDLRNVFDLALPHPNTSRAGTMASSFARVGQWRTLASDLFHPDRPGISSAALSDPAGRHPFRLQRSCL